MQSKYAKNNNFKIVYQADKPDFLPTVVSNW